jgi:hypothetical protein
MNMIFVSGKEVWDALVAEKEATVPHSTIPGRESCFQSEPLCHLQVKQHQAGFIGVELVESIHGWSVRYDTGLRGFGLIASSRYGEVDGTLAAAERFAAGWVAQDPDHRYAWTRELK